MYIYIYLSPSVWIMANKSVLGIGHTLLKVVTPKICFFDANKSCVLLPE